MTDSFNNYTWDAEGRVTAIGSIGLTYDALGRQVEQNQNGTYFQIVYSPMGSKLAVMKGQTIQQAFVPLPGGATAEYLSWGLSHYRHPDWLGSERLESNTSRSILQDTAYAPFGEPYAELSGGNGEISFTGQNKDTDWLNYDFMYREYDPRQSRWISPDPSGLAAVDPTNPQSWNRYAYVLNNPFSNVDPTGLDCIYVAGANDAAESSDSGVYVKPGDCLSSTDNGYYVPGTIVGGANGINNSDYGTAGPDGTLNFYIQGQADPTSLCISDCTGAIGGVNGDPNASLPTSGSVVIAAPFNQAVSVLGQIGITPSAVDNFLNGHNGQKNYRDSSPFCSVHVLLDPNSGQNGQPTTGGYHIDEYNPLKSVTVPAAPVTGGSLPLPLAPFHGVFDYIPDKVNDAAGKTVLTPGRNSCGG